MKARNQILTCRNLTELERLEAEYIWLGENIDVNRESLTITLLARPKEASRDAARRQAAADAAEEALSEAYYLERYNIELPD